jgi:hypothetical protein
MPSSSILSPIRLSALLGLFSQVAPSVHFALSNLTVITGIADDRILCVIEINYIDETYTDEFGAFYSKLLKMPPKHCTRIHFFNLDSGGLTGIPSLQQLSDAKDSYIGYIVTRPWLKFEDHQTGIKIINRSKDMEGRHICGAFLNPIDGNNLGLCIPRKHPKQVHLLGYPFTAQSVPFIQQDSRVGACAQAAIWVADKVMHYSYGSKRHSPSQITNYAKSSIPYGRFIPSHDDEENGLRVDQMLSALVQMGLEPLFYYWDTTCKPGLNKNSLLESIWRSIYAYVTSGIPVVLFGNHDQGKHAVAAIGFVDGDSKQSCPFTKSYAGLIFHDDQFAPYTISPSWRIDSPNLLYPKGTKSKHPLVLQGMMIPMPGKVYLTATGAIKVIQENENYRSASENDNSDISPKAVGKILTNVDSTYIKVRLVPAGQYLEAIQKLNTNGKFPLQVKLSIGRVELPRYIWISEYYAIVKGVHGVYGTVIMDSTAEACEAIVFTQFFNSISYSHDLGIQHETGHDIKTYSSPCDYVLNGRKN